MFKVKIFYPNQKIIFEKQFDSFKEVEHYTKVVIQQHGNEFSYVDISNTNIINRKEV